MLEKSQRDTCLDFGADRFYREAYERWEASLRRAEEEKKRVQEEKSNKKSKKGKKHV